MEIKFHTLAKHYCIRTYFEICKRVWKNQRWGFKFIDLYAGDGICELNLPTGETREFDSIPIQILNMAKEYPPDKIQCFFNDLDSNRHKELSLRIREYEDYVFGIENKDANIVYKEILPNLNVGGHNIFYLDPSHHNELSWNTIQGISQFSKKAYDKATNTSFERRPELFITLMTETMQRNLNRGADNDDEISQALGTCKWKEAVEEYQRKRSPVHEAFKEIFISQLEKYYPPAGIFSIEIRQVKYDNLIYYLIFAATHPKAIEIFPKLKPYIQRTQDEIWDEYVELEWRSKGQTLLKDFL